MRGELLISNTVDHFIEFSRDIELDPRVRDSTVDGRDGFEIREMLLFMVRSLVDRPDDVKIAVVPGREYSVFRIEVDPTDVGRLIGKNGRTARALEIIVDACVRNLGQSFEIEIVREPRQPNRD